MFLLSGFLICHAVGWYIELKNQKFWWRIPERKILILVIQKIFRVFQNPHVIYATTRVNSFTIHLLMTPTLYNKKVVQYSKERLKDYSDTKTVAAQTQRQIIAIRTVWRYQRVIKIRKSKDRQHNTQQKNDKQLSTKHYTEN